MFDLMGFVKKGPEGLEIVCRKGGSKTYEIIGINELVWYVFNLISNVLLGISESCSSREWGFRVNFFIMMHKKAHI